MKKIKIISVVVLVGIVICGIAAYNQENAKNTFHAFTMEMDDSGITGWHNGKKQWRISAETVTKTQDEIIFKNVQNGEFMRDYHSAVKFQTTLAEYFKETGCIEFPEGLILIVDNQKITIGKAVWKDKDNQLTAEKVCITKTDDLELKSKKMIFDAKKNVLVWQDSLEIIKGNESYKVMITANQANYFSENQSWQIDSQAEMKVFTEEKLFFVIHASNILINPEEDKIIFQDRVDIKGEKFSGNCVSAIVDHSTFIGEEIEINHYKMGNLKAGSMSVTQDERYAFQNGVICSRDDGDKVEAVQAEADSNYDIKFLNAHGVIKGKKISKIEADTLICKQNQDITANGAVSVSQDNINLQSDYMEISGQASRCLIANGNVTVQDDKGNVINTVNAIHDGKDKINFNGNVRIKQNNGTLIQGSIAEYDEKNQQIVVSGEVKAVKTDGRWIKAETMQYDIEKKRTEFLGTVESGIN